MTKLTVGQRKALLLIDAHPGEVYAFHTQSDLKRAGVSGAIKVNCTVERELMRQKLIGESYTGRTFEQTVSGLRLTQSIRTLRLTDAGRAALGWAHDHNEGRL